MVVMIPAFGAYLIPDPGRRSSSELVGDKIAQRVFIDRNLPHASALSALLMLAVFLPMLLGKWLNHMRRRRQTREGRI